MEDRSHCDSSTNIILDKSLARTKEPKGILLCVSELLTSKLLGMFREFEHLVELYAAVLASSLEITCFDGTERLIGKNSYLLLLPLGVRTRGVKPRFSVSAEYYLTIITRIKIPKQHNDSVAPRCEHPS
jgi:hypothetical protein